MRRCTRLPEAQSECLKPPIGIQVHPRVLDIYKDLAAPLHTHSRRDRARKCRHGLEADLSRGYTLQLADNVDSSMLEASLRDFQEFMQRCLGVRPGGSYRITVAHGRPDGCPADLPESFHAVIGAAGCRITTRDPDGVRRALVWLEDEMILRRAPYLPLGGFRRWPTVLDRISRSPVAPYRWMTGWELEQNRDFYPEAYLNRLMHAGINGIWVAGLLRNLVASRALPELGPREHRLELLKRLVAKAGRYGIRVFLFCIEPRCLPVDHPVFAAHPEVMGGHIAASPTTCLCTSAPLVREYIREVMHELFTAVPDLAGIINIFSGERITTCWTTSLVKGLAESCPRCRGRSQVEVLAEDLNCFMTGIRSASPSAKLLAWTYAMDFVDATSGRTIEPVLEIMRRTHPDITWLGNFEHGGRKKICGKTRVVMEYSLSCPGPSDGFRKIAGFAKKSNRICYAKTQVGVTYEISSVPFLPIPGMALAKMAAMNRTGATGTLASWIIGGEPSVMLKALGEAAFAPCLPEDRFLERLAALTWGPGQAKTVRRAWEHFAAGFTLYPFNNAVFYFGPITRAPAYLLHLEQEARLAEPYNWGIERSRDVQPFEDQVKRWCGPFTPEEVVSSFRAMGKPWGRGLTGMEKALRNAGGRECAIELAVARAAGIKFASAANVIEFYHLRDRLRESRAEKPSSLKALVNRLAGIVADDLALASAMKRVLRGHASIGFESEIYDYSYSPELIDEKIGHDRKTLQRLRRWARSGVEFDVLDRVLPTPTPDPARQAAFAKLRAACVGGD